MPYAISPFTPADLPAVHTFLRAAFTALGFPFDVATKDRDLADIPTHYQSAGGQFLCARGDADRLIATIACRRLPENTAELKRFYVDAAHQRNGLGTVLLRQMITHAHTQNFTALRLDTTRQSPAAIALFRRHNFAEIPRYNDNPRAELFMELRPIALPAD
jgi:GNAT superfamily N-acetyltransferase